MNAQPDVDRREGRIGLVWTVDADGDPATSDDRRLAVADCTGGVCDVEIPAALPAGADSASVVLKGSDEVYLAFLVRDEAGMGNQAVLWTAHYGDHGGTYNWQAQAVLDDQGGQIMAEAPQLGMGPSGEVLLTFRIFGAPGTDAALGQVALSQLGTSAQASTSPTQVAAGAASSPPLILSSTLPQWQVSVGINGSTGEAVLLSVGLPPTSTATLSVNPQPAPASTAARPRTASSILAAGGEPITSLVIDPEADPALDPALTLSQQHAAPGSSVVVTATVRNVGRLTPHSLRRHHGWDCK